MMIEIIVIGRYCVGAQLDFSNCKQAEHAERDLASPGIAQRQQTSSSIIEERQIKKFQINLLSNTILKHENRSRKREIIMRI